MCRLPADTGLGVCVYILHMYRLAADTGDEDSQSREDLVSAGYRYHSHCRNLNRELKDGTLSERRGIPCLGHLEGQMKCEIRAYQMAIRNSQQAKVSAAMVIGIGRRLRIGS
jgi:hypothetical protein